MIVRERTVTVRWCGLFHEDSMLSPTPRRSTPGGGQLWPYSLCPWWSSWWTTPSSTSPCPLSSAKFDASTTALRWVVDAYTLTMSGLLQTLGSLGDRNGRHRTLAGW
jgi:hypothetical protein